MPRVPGACLRQPDGAIALSDTRLTNDEARRIAKLISRLPELVELERDRNKARSRRKLQPIRFKPWRSVTWDPVSMGTRYSPYRRAAALPIEGHPPRAASGTEYFDALLTV